MAPRREREAWPTKTVLIVDDNPDVLAIVSELVSAQGYRAITASGGKEAIEKAKSEKPGLILLDINMPDIDGWSVLRALKQEGLTSTIKVMMLTAYTDIGMLSDTIIRFIEKSGDSVVMVDGIKFPIVNNDFEKVLRMIHHISEATMEYKSRLIVSVDPRILGLRELALLERNMEVIDAMLPGQASKSIR